MMKKIQAFKKNLNVISIGGFVGSVTAWITFSGYGFNHFLIGLCIFFFILFCINMFVNKKTKGEEVVAHFDGGFPSNNRENVNQIDD